MSNQNIIDVNSFVSLSADNVFTGQNNFTGAINDFEEVRMNCAAINGSSLTTGYSGFSMIEGPIITINSATIPASSAAGGIVTLNGSLSTQTIFFPTGTNFENQLLGVYPSGFSIPNFSTYLLKIRNVSATATVTLTANTDFIVSNMTSVTMLPKTELSLLLVRTGNHEYSVY